MPVIIASPCSDAAGGHEAMEAGAKGYLGSHAKPAEFIKAIHRALKGRTTYCRHLQQAIKKAAQLRRRKARGAEERVVLSYREKLVLHHVCCGLTSRQISYYIKLKPKTIEGYRRAVMVKTGSANVVGMVVYAIKNHLYHFEEVQG